MDGYAVRAADLTTLPATLAVIGTAAAGHAFPGRVGTGEAVRIFTGAPVPDGADAIVIQEDAGQDGATVVVRERMEDPEFIRPRGMDFQAGETLLEVGRRLGPRDLVLAAAMGHGTVPVRRRPRVAIVATGDELVPPGAQPGAGQIVVSNHLGVAALAETAGAEARFIGVARDTPADLAAHLAKADGADIVVTIGGASVGEHDLVAPVLMASGLALAFWRIAMRPGKPLMFGRLGGSRVLGLPGNPAASFVCSRLFLAPLIWRLLGRTLDGNARLTDAHAGVALEPNGPRQHYMRAVSRAGADGRREVVPAPSQSSALIAPLAQADCLIVRQPHAPAAAAGSLVPILPLDE
jgi:molybdopterin molybdotransferase